QGKKGLYLTTLSEPSLKLIQYMQQFSFFDERLMGKELIFADLGSVVRGRDADAVLKAIVSRVEQEEPVIVVIDSFKAIRDILSDPASARTFVYDLAVHTAGWGAASLFVGEYTDEEIEAHAEFTIADGIIRFRIRREQLTAVRVVEILKLRGANQVGGRHFFDIGPDGLTFFPRVRGPEPGSIPPISSADRVSTGIAGLDDMLGGGVPRTSSTVIQGATGTGKTLIGLQFLLEGARRGEPGIHFTLEETAESASRDSPRLRMGSARARESRTLLFSVCLARRAFDGRLPRSRTAAHRADRCQARGPRQPHQHGARRCLRAALQGAGLRHDQALPRPARHAQPEHGYRRPAWLRSALRLRDLFRRRQRDPAQVRGAGRETRARHFRAQGARCS